MVAARHARAVEVYLECGAKRVFACALDWPGWCRSGKTEELALETLAAYAPRYGLVAAEAGITFDPSPGTDFAVGERLRGTSTTDFGAPCVVAAADHKALAPVEARRLAAIAEAAWRVFERVVAGAPAELRKGPRGGGRDRDAVAAHVVAAEVAYARKLGLRQLRPPAAGDAEAIAAMRAAVAEMLGRPSPGSSAGEAAWPARYAARRITWHVLDHAWEIEDRSASGAL